MQETSSVRRTYPTVVAPHPKVGFHMGTYRAVGTEDQLSKSANIGSSSIAEIQIEEDLLPTAFDPQPAEGALTPKLVAGDQFQETSLLPSRLSSNHPSSRSSPPL